MILLAIELGTGGTERMTFHDFSFFIRQAVAVKEISVNSTSPIEVWLELHCGIEIRVWLELQWGIDICFKFEFTIKPEFGRVFVHDFDLNVDLSSILKFNWSLVLDFKFGLDLKSDPKLKQTDRTLNLGVWFIFFFVFRQKVEDHQTCRKRWNIFGTAMKVRRF